MKRQITVPSGFGRKRNALKILAHLLQGNPNPDRYRHQKMAIFRTRSGMIALPLFP